LIESIEVVACSKNNSTRDVSRGCAALVAWENYRRVCDWFLVRFSDSIVKRQSAGKSARKRARKRDRKRARGKAVCIEPN